MHFMFIAALFTIAKIWKQPKYPLRDECIKKMWYIYIYIYMYIYIYIYIYIYNGILVIKKNEILSFVAKELSELFHDIKSKKDKILEAYPNLERSMTICQDI